MAGDILLYQTDIVPIGDDQRQHLELTRDVAERFNARFGETFTVPGGVYPEVGRADHGPPGARREDVDDRRHGAGDGAHARPAGHDRRKKFKSAVTDSGREVRHDPEKPGVSNLIEILSVATGDAPRSIEARYDGQGYGAFKAGRGRGGGRAARRRSSAATRSCARRGRAAAPARRRRREGARGIGADARADVRADGLRRAEPHISAPARLASVRWRATRGTALRGLEQVRFRRHRPGSRATLVGSRYEGPPPTP